MDKSLPPTAAGNNAPAAQPSSAPVPTATERLRLRHWREDDFPALATLCADPAVMRYFPAPLSEEETRTLFARIRGHFEEHGFGLYAVEKKADARWVGFVGLVEVGADLPFAPATEIAWRLSPEHWYNGYATEAARAVLDFGFDSLGLEEIVAYTTESNTPSQRVMRRLGMQTCTDEDFNHPRLPADHPLRLHRLYRLPRPEEHSALSRTIGTYLRTQ